MIVQLRRRNRRFPDLTAGQPYLVIGIEADDFRLLNNQGRPYLYPCRHFDVVDAEEPDDWQTDYGEDGERYSYPEALAGVGFFEDYFDGRSEAVAAFGREVNKHLAATG